MKPDNWAQVSQLYHAALAQDASERGQFLAQACKGDEALRREVESLLEHEGSAEAFLAAPALEVAARVRAEDAGGSLSERQIGSYQVLSRLGAGGMGEVYRARDAKLNRDVALKVLPELFALDRDRLARFRREAQLLASLNHPNIAAIYGFEESNPHSGSGQATVRALVLELVEGPTLADRIARGPIPIEEALPIARQIAEALEAAHERGIIHRDLKPANIKLRPDGTVKVLDFGLAKAFDVAPSTTDVSQSPTITSPAMTGMGVILGTAAYMSPEQARGKPVDRRADIWAFGCVLYEMLTGHRAFGGDDVAGTLAGVVEREPDFDALAPAVPARVCQALRVCLRKDPKQRVGDIRDVRLALDGAFETAVPANAAAGRHGRLRHARVAWSIAAGAVAVAVLTMAATLYLRAVAPEPVVTRLDVVTPATTDGLSFALSHDGRQLTFVANGEKGSQLWLRPLDHVRAQPLAGTEGAASPFWAPDGRAIGFFADGKLKRTDPTGGTVQVLADAPVGRGGTWGADGVIVFAPGTTDPLMRVAATGGTATPVTWLAAGQSSHRWPQFLPDGRRFLFKATGPAVDTNGVYVGSLDGGEPTRVTPAETAAAYVAPGYLLVVSQGLLAAYPFDAARATVAGEPMPVAQAVGTDGTDRSAFSVSAAGVLAHREGAGGRRQLVWVDRTGKVLGAIGPPDDDASGNPELAPDDQRVALTRNRQGNNDVWLIDVGRGVLSRFTFHVATDGGALWSPDGGRIVFGSSRNGVFDVFEKPASGTADEHPLFVTSQNKVPMDWSRDGRFLLYSTQDPKTASDLWALPLMGERKPFAVMESRFNEIAGQFSPDGRWLAYVSNESGRYEIYIRTFPESGGKSQVSVAGGVQPRWRRDGRELYYVAPDTRLMAVPIRLASETHTLEAGAPVALFPTRLATGASTAAAAAGALAQYAVAADGRFLMIVAADDAVISPITIVQNWTAGLKK